MMTGWMCFTGAFRLPGLQDKAMDEVLLDRLYFRSILRFSQEVSTGMISTII